MKKTGLLIACLHLLLFVYAQPGTLDSSFGNNGSVRTDSSISCIAVQSDGKIITAEMMNNSFLISRFNIDGALDNSFDGDGKVTTDFSGGGIPRSIAIQGNGKIVVAGTTAGTATNTVIARYHSNGSLDSSFLQMEKQHCIYNGGLFPLLFTVTERLLLQEAMPDLIVTPTLLLPVCMKMVHLIVLLMV